MAITLKYGSPVPILAAGYAGGVGHRQNVLQDQGLRLWQQNQQQAFIAQKQEDQQQFWEGKQNDQQQFQAEQQQNLIGAQAQQAELNRQAQSDAKIAHGLAKGEYEYLPGVQDKINQLDSGFAELSGLAPAGQEEFAQEHAKRRQALERMVRPKIAPEMPYQERLNTFKQTIPEEHRGLPWILDEKGVGHLPQGFKNPGDDQQKQYADEVKTYHTDAKAYQKELRALAKEMAGNASPETGQPEKQASDFMEQARIELEKQGVSHPTAPVRPQQPAQQAATQPAAQPQQQPTAPPTAAPVQQPQPVLNPLAQAAQGVGYYLGQAAGAVMPAPGGQPSAPAAQSPSASSPSSGQPAANRQWTPEAISASLQTINPNLPPEIRSKITPQAVMEAQNLGVPDPVRSAVFLAVMRAGPEKTNAPAKKAEDLPAATRSKLARPQTEQEIAALAKQYGSGVEFEWTDGLIYRTK